MQSQIKTPLLRLIVRFYGNLGFQILPICRSNRLSCLNLTWNICLFSILAYFMIAKDVYRFSEVASDFSTTKPFFAFLVQLFIYYAQSASGIFNSVYFLFFGSQLTAALDGPLFQQVYRSTRQAWCIFLSGIALHNLNTLILYHNYFETFFNEPKTTLSCLSMIVMYIFGVQSYFVFNIVLYQQYAARKTLQKVEESLEENPHEYAHIERQIRHLAYCQKKVNQLLSAPLAVLLYCHLENVLVIVCMTLFKVQASGLKEATRLFYPALTWAYITLLVHLNRVNKLTFERICETATDNCANDTNDSRLSLESETGHSWNAKLSEMRLYGKYLDISVFRLFKLNSSFLLHAALFALNYTVFLAQTN